MPRGKKFAAEQIIGKFREAEVGLAQGKTVPEVVRKLGVTEQTYYRWKRKYSGLRTDQAKRLKDAGKENARLKQLQTVEHVRDTVGRDVVTDTWTLWRRDGWERYSVTYPRDKPPNV